MLIVVTKIPGTQKEYEIPFHVGYNCSIRDTLRVNCPKHEVLAVQADGDELVYLKEIFTNIPFGNSRVQLWHGDFAKFIAHNAIL